MGIKKETPVLGAAAKEAALLRGMERCGICRNEALAYEKYGMEACSIKGPYQYNRLTYLLKSEDGRLTFCTALEEHQSTETIMNFYIGYLGLEDYLVEDKPEPEEDDDFFDEVGVDQMLEDSIDWDLFSPAKSFSMTELTELMDSEAMDMNTDLEQDLEEHDGLLYVIESHVSKMKIKEHNIDIPYVEVPGVDYHQLKEDYEVAPHLKTMEKVMDTLITKGKAMLVASSKHTAITALRYVGAVFSCSGTYTGDAEDEAFYNHAYSLQDKLLLVSADELNLWAGGVQFQSLNSGMFQHKMSSATKNMRAPWELFEDVPLAVIIDRYDNPSSGFTDQIEELMKFHKPLLVVFIKNDLLSEEMNMGIFLDAMTNNRDMIADDISFTLDFDVFEIEEPEVSGEYYQTVARTVAHLLGCELDENLDLPELLTRLRKIRKHRWAGNTTIRQAISKAVSLKEVDDGVLRLSDFDYLGKSLVNQRLKAEAQMDNNTDALTRMNRELVGLDTVKEQIMTAVSALEMNKLRQKAGLVCPPLHNTFVFQGPPGTGKTEMARHLMSIMSEKGLIEESEEGIAFVSGNNLRGEYLGSTAPKIERLFNDHSAIFIDEAYTLVSKNQGKTDSYSQEALGELCIQLEKHSTRKLVIFAGYASDDHEDHNKMREFLEQNPGINSRISHYVTFPNYQPEELMPILEGMAAKSDFVMEEGYQHIALEMFATRHKNKSFGNGREVRRLFEMAVSHQAARLTKKVAKGEDVAVEDLKTITLDDLRAAVDTILSAQQGLKEKQANAVGFVM